MTLRTSRFLPSRMANTSQTLAPWSRSSVASIAPYLTPSTSMPALQFVELRLRHLAMGAHAVAAEPAGVGQFKGARKPAIIGEQQQSLGVEIEPADRDQPRQALRQIVEYCRPAFRIGMRRHQPARLVIEEQPRALARRQWLAVDGNDVIGGDIERRRIDDAAVHGDAPLTSPSPRRRGAKRARRAPAPWRSARRLSSASVSSRGGRRSKSGLRSR